MDTKLNKKAFTLVEILIAVSILSVVSVTVASTVTDVMRIQRQILVTNTALRIEDQIRGNLVNGAAWANSVAATSNASLLCLRSPQDLRDCRGQGGSFTVYDAGGQIVLNPQSQGFNLKGDVCSNVGQGDCLFKTSVQWQAICPSAGPCSDPQVDFNVAIDYLGTQGQKFNYNKKKHSFKLTQSGEVNSLVRSCESVGGTFDTITKQCILSGLAGDCPPSYVVVQVTPAMNRVCRPMFVGSCDSSKYMVAINSDGTPICQDRPQCPKPDVATETTTEGSSTGSSVGDSGSDSSGSGDSGSGSGDCGSDGSGDCGAGE